MHDKIEAILDSPIFVPAVIGATSFVGGLGLGYFLGKRKAEEVYVHEVPAQLEFDYQAVHETEDELVFEDVEVEVDTRVVIDEETAKKKGFLKIDSLQSLRPEMLNGEDPDEVFPTIEQLADDSETVVTIEAEPSHIPWDWEEELPKRSETTPYILHQEEFFNDENGYSQVSLTYFAVDGILVDEDDKPIYNHSSVTGPLVFGHGSGDENVVYIRNDELSAEYEVTQVDGLYSREVLGLEIEENVRVADIKHSKHTKFRDVD